MIDSNSVTSIIKNIKEKVDDMLLEKYIENDFKNNNTKFMLCKRDIIIPIFLYGKIEKNELSVYGDHNIEKGSIVVNECNNKAYYVIETKKVEISTKYKSNIYIRKGTKILLDENVQEVKVIKAKNKYYLYKE